MRRPMTRDKLAKCLPTVPFVFRFAQQMVETPHQALRYDAARQVSQILVDGHWVDSRHESGGQMASTRITAVRRETTDDE